MGRLKFGSEETYALIGETLKGGDPAAYENLFKILDHDLEILTNKYAIRYSDNVLLPLSDREDIRQDIMIKMCREIEEALKGEMIKGLPKFYRESRDNSEQQRNAWLIKVVKNKVKDFCREMGRHEKHLEPKWNDPEHEGDNTWFDKVSALDFTAQLEDRESFFNALRRVFQSGSAPDSLLAFVYNQVLWSLNSTNGEPQIVADELRGKTLSAIYDQMTKELSCVLGCAIPDDILEPLKVKVDSEPDKEFFLSSNVITKRSSDIKRRIKKLKKENRLNE